VLVFGGPLSLKQLARAEQVKPPTMSRIVDGLEKAGLARRRAHPTDRRAVILESTEKGGQLLRQGRKRRVKFLAGYLARLDAGERRSLEAAVSALQKALR
jgi:DNA-binding MarR family transcriptional regulator